MTKTYDFDGVMHTSVRGIHPTSWDPADWAPNERCLSLLRKDIETGVTAYIVTARPPECVWDIKDYLSDNGIEIAVNRIVCTDNRPKLPFVKRVGSEVHYDDNPAVWHELKAGGVRVVKVIDGVPEDEDDSVFESEDAKILRDGMLVIKGNVRPQGTRRVYVVRLKGRAQADRLRKDNTKGSSANFVFISDEVYVVKEVDGALKALRCEYSGAIKAMGLSSPAVVLNDNKTPFHWKARTYSSPGKLVSDYEAALREIPDADFS